MKEEEGERRTKEESDIRYIRVQRRSAKEGGGLLCWEEAVCSRGTDGPCVRVKPSCYTHPTHLPTSHLRVLLPLYLSYSLLSYRKHFLNPHINNILPFIVDVHGLRCGAADLQVPP